MERQQPPAQPLRAHTPGYGGSQASSLPSKKKHKRSLAFGAWDPQGEKGDIGGLAAWPHGCLHGAWQLLPSQGRRLRSTLQHSDSQTLVRRLGEVFDSPNAAPADMNSAVLPP